MSRLVPAPLQKAALLHDAAEAYLGDVIRPLKHLLQPRYGELGALWERAIGERFDVDPALFSHRDVKHADRVALMAERRDLVNLTRLRDGGDAWAFEETATEEVPRLRGKIPAHARVDFLIRWNAVTGEVAK